MVEVVDERKRKPYMREYADLFKAVFGSLGRYQDQADAMGTSLGAIGDRSSGKRSLPGQFERVLLCAAMEAFGDDQEAMRAFIEAGLRRMRKIEGEEKPS